jgi:hypothetical protein
MTDETTQPSWFIDDGIPGVGERPSWLPDKYKTVADLAKSNSELEKRLGTAPEKYDFSRSKFLNPEFAPFQELQAFAKEKRVSQDVMDKFIDSVDKYMDDFKINPDEEIKALGENAKERVEILDNWAKANLSKDSYEALIGSVNTASSIKALEELRGKFMSSTPQIPGNNGTIASAATLDDVKQELVNNIGKYKTDEAYRKDIQGRLELAAKNTPGFVDKVGA